MAEMAKSTERLSRVGAFYRIIEKHNPIAISIRIDVKELKNARDRIWALGTHINWYPFDNPYVFTFRCLMDGFHARRSEFANLIGADDAVDFIFDQQSEKKIILSFWDEYVASRNEKDRKLYGTTPRFEDDKKFLPLQAADLWAWWTRHWYEQGVEGESQKFNLPGWTGGNTTIYGLEISFNEDQIVEAFLELIRSSQPSASVYDKEYIRARK